MSDKKSIIDLLKEQMTEEDSLPPLNKNSVKLQNELLKSDPSYRKIESMIKLDPSLTGQVLKIANSAYYKGLESVDTVKDAMSRLGGTELGNTLMWIIHQGNFKSNDAFVRKYQNRLWQHSVSCALGCLWTSKYLELEELVSGSFIVGLLHDMGKLYLLTCFEKLKENKKIQNFPSMALIEAVLDKLHTSQGYKLLKKWNLNDNYCVIARDHHAVEFDENNLLLVLVRLVNQVCIKMESGNTKEDMAAVVGSVEANILGVSEIGVAEMEIAIEESQKKFV